MCNWNTGHEYLKSVMQASGFIRKFSCYITDACQPNNEHVSQDENKEQKLI